MSEGKPLVSILCPCYNSEEYIGRMLNSILKQKYPSIELICIDDGSVDGTSEIINDYIPIFNDAGSSLINIYQEHRGQAVAVNAGLKVIKGDYFTLLDSDDFLTDDSILMRVDALENNRDYSIVVSDYNIVNEVDLSSVVGKGNDYIGNLCYQPNQFYLTLIGYSSVATLGYMIRTEDMRKINSRMEIHECIEGQNYQILLPLYYHFKRIYIDKPLGYYVVRKDSHAHMERTREETLVRNTNLLHMLEEILIKLDIPCLEIQKYLKLSVFYDHLEDA